MALSQQQSIAQYGTEAYTGWGEAEAAADAAAHPEKLGNAGGGETANSILSNFVDYITKLVPDNPPDYEEVNPFFFDEALAKEASTAEYSPYYDELLSDYISKTQRTIDRSEDDLKSTLERLSASKEYYLGKERRMLDQSLRQTKEGYAGRGLYFSGAKDRDIKELETEYGAKIQDYLGGYDYTTGQAKIGAARTTEDVTTGRKEYTRDIGREKDYAIEAGVLQRKGETQDEYLLSKNKYYEQFYTPGLT